jgi:hypothetical protein
MKYNTQNKEQHFDLFFSDNEISVSNSLETDLTAANIFTTVREPSCRLKFRVQLRGNRPADIKGGFQLCGNRPAGKKNAFHEVGKRHAKEKHASTKLENVFSTKKSFSNCVESYLWSKKSFSNFVESVFLTKKSFSNFVDDIFEAERARPTARKTSFRQNRFVQLRGKHLFSKTSSSNCV